MMNTNIVEEVEMPKKVKNKLEHKFELKDYWKKHKVAGAVYTSKPFGNKNGDRFQVTIVKDGRTRESKHHLSAMLFVLNAEKQGKEKMKVTFEIETRDGRERLSQLRDVFKLKEKLVIAASRLLPHRKMIQEPDRFVPNNTLTLVTTVTVIGQKKEVDEDDSEDMPDVAEMLKRMSYTEGEPDLILVASDGFEHKIHRKLLMARSPYFKEILTTHNDPRVELPNVRSSILSKIIDYMYSSDTSHIETADLLQVMGTTAALQIHGLHKTLEERMCKKMNVWNAFQVYRLSDKLASPRLTREAMQLMEYDMEDVLTSHEWLEFETARPLEAIKMYRYIVENRFMHNKPEMKKLEHDYWQMTKLYQDRIETKDDDDIARIQRPWQQRMIEVVNEVKEKEPQGPPIKCEATMQKVWYPAEQPKFVMVPEDNGERPKLMRPIGQPITLSDGTKIFWSTPPYPIEDNEKIPPASDDSGVKDL